MEIKQVSKLIKDHCAQFTDRFPCRVRPADAGKFPCWIKTLTQEGDRVYVRLECPATGHSYGPIEREPCPDAAEFERRVDQAVESLMTAHTVAVASAMAAMRDTSWLQDG